MSPLRYRFAVFSAAVAVLGLPGCGSEGLAPVGGTITHRGHPVGTGEVHFLPAAGGGRGAHGALDSQGPSRLSTFATDDGAAPGAYVVTVVSQGPDKPPPPNMKGKMLAEQMQGTGDPLIPKRYFSPTSSGLKAAVVAGQSNVVNFDLPD